MKLEEKGQKMKKNGKISTITSPNHGKYVGEAKGFIRHGHGTYTWESGTRYTGDWVNGEMEGKGTLTYPGGSKFVGIFKDGLEHEGTMTYADDSKYVGMFKYGVEHGEGTFTASDGFKYEGEFVEGRPVGANANGDQHLPQIAPPDPKAEEWADRNVWFGNDEIMTLASFSIHRKLVDEGFKPSSDEYYQEIDNYIRSEFPQKFSKGKYIGDDSKKQLH